MTSMMRIRTNCWTSRTIRRTSRTIRKTIISRRKRRKSRKVLPTRKKYKYFLLESVEYRKN